MFYELFGKYADLTNRVGGFTVKNHPKVQWIYHRLMGFPSLIAGIICHMAYGQILKLVGGFKHLFIFHFIYGRILTKLTNSMIFQRGRLKPPTSVTQHPLMKSNQSIGCIHWYIDVDERFKFHEHWQILITSADFEKFTACFCFRPLCPKRFQGNLPPLSSRRTGAASREPREVG